MKNLMERFIQHIQDRTECFDDHFHAGKKDVTGSMSGIGSDYFCYTCTWTQTEYGLPHT